ncbi:MAG: YdcF family protein [Chitinophagaceae bacterium]
MLYKPCYDAIIVPGIPFRNGRWDTVMKARVLWSVYLYKNHFTKNIIYSGSAVYTPFYESIIMGLYAQKLGVPAQHIFYDTLAKHSTENIYYSYLIAQKNGFKNIALATDPFQNALIQFYTRKKFASTIDHIPVLFDSIKTMSPIEISIDSSLAYRKHFQSIKAKESFIYRFWGTMGRQVDYGTKNRLGRL